VSQYYKRCLILGGSGKVGRIVTSYLSKKYCVFFTSRNPTQLGNAKNVLWRFENNRKNGVLDIIRDAKPDCIINCLQGKGKECYGVNAYVPWILSKYNCLPVIHISTNAVFGVDKANPIRLYSNKEVPDADSYYGDYSMSKLLGEHPEEHLVIRSSIFPGSAKTRDTDRYWNGISALKLAEMIELILLKRIQPGIRHYHSDIIKYSKLVRCYEKYHKEQIRCVFEHFQQKGALLKGEYIQESYLVMVNKQELYRRSALL
jgi:dTDP-4-dehydrorhamnose reductase